MLVYEKSPPVKADVKILINNANKDRYVYIYSFLHSFSMYQLGIIYCITVSPCISVCYYYRVVPSVYLLKLSKIACHPACCISMELVLSASKVSITSVLFFRPIKVILTFLPSSKVYAISYCNLTSS